MASGDESFGSAADESSGDDESVLSDLEKTINRCIEKTLKSAIKKALQSFKNDMKKLIDKKIAEIDKFKKEFKTVKDNYDVVRKDVDALKRENITLRADMNAVQRENNTLRADVNAAISSSNDVEQYGRRWLIRLHNVPAQEKEDCIQTCAAMFREKLGVPIENNEIEAAHRLRPRTDGRPPAIIARFMRRDRRQKVLEVRKKLKGSGVSISEDLTHMNMKLLNRVQNHEAISESWACNGNIYGIPTGTKIKVVFKLFKPVEDSIKEALDNRDKRSLRPRPASVRS